MAAKGANALRLLRRLRLGLAALALLAGVSGCGGGQEAARRPIAPLQRELALLPGLPGRTQLLFGDLDRLRAAYPDRADFRRALAGVWLPDGLVGAQQALWPRSFGFDLGSIDRFAAGGFHPAELLVASGHFRPEAVRSTLRARGYVLEDGLMRRGADGSLDARTPAGRLALSSLNRIRVTKTRLIAASTTALAEAAFEPGATFATDRDLAVAAAALGEVTSAALFPARIVRPPERALVIPLVQHRPIILGAGIDDRGTGERILKLVLVYANASEARSDAKLLDSQLAKTPLPSTPHARFGALADGLRAEAAASRAVLVSGKLQASEHSGLWRSLLERGDVAVLVRRG